MKPHDDTACDEYRTLSRRGFLGVAASAAAATASTAWTSPRVILSGCRDSGMTRPAVIGIFFRGAQDGLSFVVPYGDPDYSAARPVLAIPAPGVAGGAVDLDGYFGLNPNAAPLVTPFAAGALAFVHATGSTDPTRSHFEGMRTMESGIPDNPASEEASGWLGRHLQSVLPSASSDLRAMALDELLPRVLAAGPGSVAIPDPIDLRIHGQPSTAALRRAVLTQTYAQTVAPLAPTASSSIAAIDTLATVDFLAYVPANGASYPETSLGLALKRAATLIKAQVGLEAFHHDYGGWDHHYALGPVTGAFGGAIGDVAACLEAFYLDMRGQESSYVLYTKSEFGRQVAENASQGLDHGSGSVMAVMGRGVQGGAIHGGWPTCAPGQRLDGALRIETDYRDVIAEILTAGLGGTDLPYVFEGFAPTPVGVVV